MKQMIVSMVVTVVLCGGAIVWAEAAEPEPISIDLAYRGLDGKAGRMQYGFAMGYGRPRDVEDTPFIEAVRQRAGGDVEIVYNRGFEDRTLSAVEVVDGEPKRFYFDANADGELSDDEITGPANSQTRINSRRFDFVTPDFAMTSETGDKVPFRVKLAVNYYGGNARPSCMWSPACVLEGAGRIAGKERRLVLFVGNLAPDFFQYGRGTYAFLDPGKEVQYPARATLSSLIFYEDTFYKLRFEGSFKEPDSLRAILVRDTSPTGALAVELQGKEELATRIAYASVNGKSDPTVRFQIRKSQEFPVGRYVLQSGQFQFGRGDVRNWQVRFSEGPNFSIEDGKTVTVKLGDPELTVRSVDENKRYSRDVQNLDRFPTGSRIYISPVVSGADGETYSRFQKTQGIMAALSRRFSDVKPHLMIEGPSGKQIVDKDLEYG